MRGGRIMDDFFSVDLFNKNISSLKETSKDKQKESISIHDGF